ncbi:MAG: hypothetical protein K2Y20_15080 [Sphingomonas sp.]|nr:hypothetical protein [Sphingomonas sp.]
MPLVSGPVEAGYAITETTVNTMAGDFRVRTDAGAAPRVIVLELNELCPPLLARWMAEGRLPNFQRLYDRSDVFTTLADVDDPGQLEPWIQWYSVHTGLAFDQHRVFHLTEGARAGHADWYQLLLAAGRSVGSFASMNVAPFAAEGSFFASDPWSENGDAYPAGLNIYNRFVGQQVREYSNTRNGLGLGGYAQFLSFMVANGLSPSTVTMILRQLAAERTGDRRLSYRRVAILDRLQYDLFSRFYARTRPDLATFFLNSTAHLQHAYWRHMDPDSFTVRPDDDELAIYGDAVRFGYEAMDKLVGAFARLADRHGARLIFMSALSQQPFLRHETTGGQHFHRLHDATSFLKRLGIAFDDVDPTMTHQYMVRFASIEAASAARQRLEALQMADGRALFGFATRSPGETGLYFGCQISAKTDNQAIVIDTATGERLTFGTILYAIDAIKSGRHHPEGALWISGRHGRVHDERVSILDVFPTLFDLLGQAQPSGDRRGRSLAARLNV